MNPFAAPPLSPLIPVPGRVLGVDPGLHVTGYAVVEVAARGEPPDRRLRICEAGVVRTADDMPLGERLARIFWGINEVLEAHRPEALALEQLYSVYKHPRTAILMGHARGVISLAAAQRGIPIVSYAATRVKKTVTGSGRAPKDQVQRAIQHQFGLDHPPEPHDVADALALAICHHAARRGELARGAVPGGAVRIRSSGEGTVADRTGRGAGGTARDHENHRDPDPGQPGRDFPGGRPF